MKRYAGEKAKAIIQVCSVWTQNLACSHWDKSEGLNLALITSSVGTRAEVAFKHDYSGVFGCLPTKYAAPSLIFWFFGSF
jgi:hypothetical protein